MKPLAKVLVALSILLFLFTFGCGSCIALSGPVDASSLTFHMGLGILTMASTIATFWALMRSTPTKS